MIKLKEKMIIQQGKYGRLKFVKFEYENDEVTFETYDDINLNAIYYDTAKDLDRTVTMDNFSEEILDMVREILKKQ